MLNSFAFRQLFMADSGLSQPAVGAWPKMTNDPKKSKPYVLKRGGKDEEILNLLKMFKGTETVESLASMLTKRGGGVMEPQSLRQRISVIKGFLESRNIDPDKIAAILPKNFGTGQRGRQAQPEMGADVLADFFGDVEAKESDDNEESDASNL